MSFARACRLLLALATALIVVWSFVDVIHRFASEEAGQRGKITLTILHWGDNAENGITDSLVARYESEHPDIHIQNISAADYDPKLKTMFAAGTPPDVFYLDYARVSEMASLGVVAPIDGYL